MARMANDGVEALRVNLRGGPPGRPMGDWGTRCSGGRWIRGAGATRSRVNVVADPLTLGLRGLGGLTGAVTVRRLGRLRMSTPLCSFCSGLDIGVASSSSRPMSSKLEMSVRMLSVLLVDDDGLVDAFEDLEAVNPGGDPGASSTIAFIASQSAGSSRIKGLCRNFAGLGIFSS